MYIVHFFFSSYQYQKQSNRWLSSGSFSCASGIEQNMGNYIRRDFSMLSPKSYVTKFFLLLVTEFADKKVGLGDTDVVNKISDCDCS